MDRSNQTRDIVNAIAWAVICLGWPPITMLVTPGGQLIDLLIFVAITVAWAASPLMAARAWIRAKALEPDASWDRIGLPLVVGWGLIVVAEVAFLGTRFGFWTL